MKRLSDNARDIRDSWAIGRVRYIGASPMNQWVLSTFVGESDAHEQDLAALFGNGHGLDSYTTKRRYSLQESAFSSPFAYIGIYQATA